MKDWGLPPDEVKRHLRDKGWFSLKRLRDVLSGEAFPHVVALNPPTGRQALEDLPRFNRFLNAWRVWSNQNQVEWRETDYREIGIKHVPIRFVLRNVYDVIQMGGKDFSALWKHVNERLELFDAYPGLRDTLIKKLPLLEKITLAEAATLAAILPQLSAQTGGDVYLRSFPLHGADTKFLERHTPLVLVLLNTLHALDLKDIKDLCNWLGCRPKPHNWLTIRPLCPMCAGLVSEFSVFKVPADLYLQQPLPAQRILIVENEETLFALPSLPQCIAIGGGGNNLTCLDAPWLENVRHIAYWGDLDTWGLTILARARSKIPTLRSLLMDEETLSLHFDRLVTENDPREMPENGLTEEEERVFARLRQLLPQSRLEQERLKQDYIIQKLMEWAS